MLCRKEQSERKTLMSAGEFAAFPMRSKRSGPAHEFLKMSLET
jgi:hypothetical protein